MEEKKDPLQIEVVTAHHNNGALGTTQYSYVRKPRDTSGYYLIANYYETAEKTTVPDLLTKILHALEELGIELYHVPGKAADWGLRKKPAPKKPNGRSK